MMHYARILPILFFMAVLGGCQNAGTSTLSKASPNQGIAIAPIVNATGRPLPLPGGTVLDDLRQMLGIGEEETLTVPDLLLGRFILAAGAQGYSVLSFEKTHAVFAGSSSDMAAVIEKARAAGLQGSVVLVILRRWDDSLWFSSRIIFVSMDIAVARISDGKTLDVKTIHNYAVPVSASISPYQATNDAARWVADHLF
jgi:hypothetical protein